MDSEIWEVAFRLRPHIDLNNHKPAYFGAHKNLGNKKDILLSSDNQN